MNPNSDGDSGEPQRRWPWCAGLGTAPRADQGDWSRYRDVVRAYFGEDAPAWGLLDISVPNTDESDWQTVIDLIADSGVRSEFFVDHHSAPLPRADAVSSQSDSEDGPHLLLRIDRGHLALNSFLTDSNEIDFDVRANDIAGPEQLGELLGFMRAVGTLVGKPVVLTGEGDQAVLLRFHPGSGTLEWSVSADSPAG